MSTPREPKISRSFNLTRYFFLHRWDSSDPDRAPPPLPLNPGSSSPITKPNTSATIAATAEAFVAKARESIYTQNALQPKSPDKSLIKGQYHKRMQSSSGAVKDLSSYLENGRSPDRSPERPLRATWDFENRSPDRSPTRSSTPTPTARDIGKDMPNLRPASRPGLKAILGETPPQSAAMRALKDTPASDIDTSLSNITNGSTALVRSPQSFEGISSQILSLTSIATNLQREMAQLSRRSKDNATDLVSLKEATNARDEDIRKSLRDLVTGLTIKMPEGESTPRQYHRSPGSYLLEEKPHGSPGGLKSVSLPRIPSPASFAASLDRELVNSPNPYSVDGAAAIALLEKILREMATKEGQERLLASVSVVNAAAPLGKDNGIGKQLEDVLRLLKENNESSRALVRATNGGHGKPPQLELDFDRRGSMPMAKTSRNMTPIFAPHGSPGHQTGPKPADVVNEDMVKLLNRMKDSITEGGGLSAEIKALVRELRGEVLGMGREIGRKLDQSEQAQKKANSKEVPRGPGREEISAIVEQGLDELRDHFDQIMKEYRRQSSSSVVSKNPVDADEVYNVVKTALQELPQPKHVVEQHGSGIERDEILEAVREAWETYKPEIELQNFGLERDEILQCLKEGLEDYRPQDASKEQSHLIHDEVLEAVSEGLRNFKPPPIETEASITREEIIMCVRECLESFDFPMHSPPQDKESDLTRAEVMDAIRDGIATQGPLTKEIEFNRDDLFDAVRVAFESAPTVTGGVGEQVLEKMQDLIEGMRSEFQEYSSANGRDTEQVLDAMKDGLEVLRGSIETYVDRAADVTGKDEIIETVRDGLEHLRIDLEGSIANAPRGTSGNNSSEILDAMEKEFEHLRSTLSSSMARSGSVSSTSGDVMDAINDGFDEIKAKITANKSTSDPDSIDAIKEELQHLRETLATTLTRGGGDLFDREEILQAIQEGIDRAQLSATKNSGRPESILSNTSELLDAFNDGLDGLKNDVERIVNKPIDMTVNYEILDTLKEGLASVRADIDRLHAQQAEHESVSTKRGNEVVVAEEEPPRSLGRPDIENLEVMITQLKIKVEALDNMPPPPPQQPAEDVVVKTDFERLETLLKETQATVSELVEREQAQAENTVTKEDTDAIETLLRNTKAKLDELVFPEPENMAKIEHLDSIEIALKSTKEAVDELKSKHEEESATKTDVGIIEVILKEMQTTFDEM